MDMEQSIDYFTRGEGWTQGPTPPVDGVYNMSIQALPIYGLPIYAIGIPVTSGAPPYGNLGLIQNGINLPPGYDTPDAIINYVRQFCMQQLTCAGGGKSKIQKGGARGTGALAWGITAAIIAGTTFAAVLGWGAAEKILAGAWFLPRLCGGTELMLTALGFGPRGTQSCAARANRYAWLAKILATLLLTSGTAIATQFNPARIQQWVKDKLDNFYTFLEGRGKLNKQCEDPKDELQLMNEWLQTQDPKFYSEIQIDSNAPINPQISQTMDAIVVAAVNAANEDANNAAAANADAVTATSAPSSQTWTEYWKDIVEKVNASRPVNASRAGGKRRRRTRHRKNKNLKNKKSKRRMLKRKASKRRRNKRNKTRR